MATGLQMFDALRQATKGLPLGSRFGINTFDAQDLMTLTECDLRGRGFDDCVAEHIGRDLAQGHLTELGRGIGIDLALDRRADNLISGEGLLNGDGGQNNEGQRNGLLHQRPPSPLVIPRVRIEQAWYLLVELAPPAIRRGSQCLGHAATSDILRGTQVKGRRLRERLDERHSPFGIDRRQRSPRYFRDPIVAIGSECLNLLGNRPGQHTRRGAIVATDKHRKHARHDGATVLLGQAHWTRRPHGHRSPKISVNPRRIDALGHRQQRRGQYGGVRRDLARGDAIRRGLLK